MFSFLRSPLFIASCCALTLSGCDCDDHRTVCANGPDVSETRPIADLSRLNVAHSADVYLTQDSVPSLRLEAPRNVLAVLRTETVGGELRLSTAPGVNLKLNAPVRVYLSLPALTALTGSGSTHFRGATAWRVNDLVLGLSGASTADLAVTATGALRTDASGASQVLLRGATPQHTVTLSGASKLEAFDLTTGTADIDASGASQARVTVATALAVSASGASEVYYQGNPTVTVRTVSGGARLVKVN